MSVELTNQQYHADRTAVSKTWLDFIERSPAHLKAYLDGDIKFSSRSLNVGTMAHELILEEDLFLSKYVMLPEGIKRPTKAQYNAKKPSDKTIQLIQWWDEWEAENQGKEAITPKDYKLIFNIRDAVMRHSKAKAIFGQGDAEQSTFWNDDTTGERCKARADWLRDNWIIDLKTTRDAREFEFSKSIWNYRYHVQSAHYSDGFDKRPFAFVVVETEPPHGVMVYVAGDEMLKKGHQDRLRNLQIYSECRNTQKWPSYSETITPISLPRWARS